MRFVGVGRSHGLDRTSVRGEPWDVLPSGGCFKGLVGDTTQTLNDNYIAGCDRRPTANFGGGL